MNRYIVLLAPALAAISIAGCGSSSHSSSASPPGASSASTPAQPSSTAPTTTRPSTPALISTKHGKLGTILASGPKKLTVYLFEADKRSGSSCNGACAAVWPPVTTVGHAQSSGSALGAELGTTTRPDGTTQVTYAGHPLYLYAKDKDDGDAYGQGLKDFGAGWYVLSPSGRKVDRS